MADDYQENRRRFLSDFSDDYGEGPYSDYDPSSFNFDLDIGSLGSNAELGLNFDWGDLSKLAADPNLFAAFAEANPEDAALLRDLIGGDYGFSPVGDDNIITGGNLETDDAVVTDKNQIVSASGDAIKDIITGGNLEDDFVVTDKNQIVSTSGDVKESMDSPNRGGATDQTTDKPKDKKPKDETPDKKGILGTDITASDAAKYAAMLAMARLAYDDAERARKEARGATSKGGYAEKAIRSPSGSYTFKKAMGGGIGSLDMAQGGRALPPRYLNGHSDGMADKVPAHIDNKRPAALSDGEFVIPADVVSHLGNGNSNAGAKRLYEMMDRIRAARTGNRKQGKQINPDKFMPR